MLLLSCSVMSDSLWPHESKDRAALLFSCLQSFLASGSFPVSWLFTSGGQSIRASASSSVLPMNTQGWFPLGLTGLISLQSKGLSRVFSSTVIKKHWFFSTQPSLWPNSHIYMTTGKTIALTIQTFVSQVTSLLFSTLSRFVIAFLPRSQAPFSFMAAVIICSDFAKKIKSVTVSIVAPSVCHEVMGLLAMIFVFWMLIFKPAFSLSMDTTYWPHTMKLSIILNANPFNSQTML